MKNPPRRINGRIKLSPTHHEAPDLIVKALIKTAIAAGLKICFFLITKIYFEAIAKNPVKVNVSIFSKRASGPTIKVKIKAVM